MYEQSLVQVIEPVKRTTISRLNKGKKWKYGYDKEHDIIVISKTGQIGEIYEIQNLRIALPKATNIHSRSKKKEEQYWEQFEKKPELKNIKTIFDAFEILNRIQEEENLLEGKEPEEKKVKAFQGFAEGRSK